MTSDKEFKKWLEKRANDAKLSEREMEELMEFLFENREEIKLSEIRELTSWLKSRLAERSKDERKTLLDWIYHLIPKKLNQELEDKERI